MLQEKTEPLTCTLDRVVEAFKVCNVCGRRIQTFPQGSGINVEAQECEAFAVFGGYGNRHHGDCTALRWHACQDCIAEWIAIFHHPPESAEFEPFRFGDEQKARKWMRFEKE